MDTKLLKEALTNLAEAYTLTEHWAKINQRPGLATVLRRISECQETLVTLDRDLGDPEPTRPAEEVIKELLDLPQHEDDGDFPEGDF